MLLPHAANNKNKEENCRLRSAMDADNGLTSSSALLTDDEIRQLSAYFSSIQLSPDQCDRIADKFVEASSTERRIICQVYCKIFSDPVFVQRLTVRVDSRRAASAAASGARPSRTELRLRHAVDEIVPRLAGDGPFAIQFGLISNEEERKEILDLYASQFTHPDAATMQKIVTLPRSQSTRTRKIVVGSHTWFIKSLTTGEIVCCVTAVVHRFSTCFVEVPLFATRAGYKKNGFARLLNAALVQFCVDHVKDCAFLMVSADKNAVPFWSHLGFEEITRQHFQSISFFYEHNCLKFVDSLTMTVPIPEIRKMRDQRFRAIQESQALSKLQGEEDGDASEVMKESMLVQDVLEKMRRFVVSGALYLQGVDGHYNS